MQHHLNKKNGCGYCTVTYRTKSWQLSPTFVCRTHTTVNCFLPFFPLATITLHVIVFAKFTNAIFAHLTFRIYYLPFLSSCRDSLLATSLTLLYYFVFATLYITRLVMLLLLFTCRRILFVYFCCHC